MGESLSVVDFVIIILFVISLVVGYSRGLVKELIPLLSLVAAVLFGISYADILQSLIPSDFFGDGLSVWGLGVTITSESIIQAMGFCVIFSAVWILGYAFSYWLTSFLESYSMNFVNKFFGGVFGLVRAAFLVMVFILVAALTNISNYEWFENSVLVPEFRELALSTVDWIPFSIGDSLRATLSGIPSPSELISDPPLE